VACGQCNKKASGGSLPFEQQKILPFPPFGFLIEKESGLGLIDTLGKWVLQPEFKTIKRFEAAYFLVENQNGLGLCDSNGEVLLPCIYQRIVRFDSDVFQLTSADGLLYFLISERNIITLQP
jgi:WG containing repeat